MSALFRKRPLVVIVCTANITRSPYFAARLRQELTDASVPEKNQPEIVSAGALASPGTPAHPVIQTLARLHGFSLSNHVSRPFTSELADRATLVLTMEVRHTELLLDQFPTLAGKVYPLLEYGRDGSPPDGSDVPDPTGGEPDEYQQFVDIADAQAMRLRRLYLRKGHF